MKKNNKSGFLLNVFEKMISHKLWRRVTGALMALVVFLTTYMMILPALTIDLDTVAEEPGMELAVAGSSADQLVYDDAGGLRSGEGELQTADVIEDLSGNPVSFSEQPEQVSFVDETAQGAVIAEDGEISDLEITENNTSPEMFDDSVLPQEELGGEQQESLVEIPEEFGEELSEGSVDDQGEFNDELTVDFVGNVEEMTDGVPVDEQESVDDATESVDLYIESNVEEIVEEPENEENNAVGSVSAHVLKSEGEDYRVTVSYTDEAEIPEGAELLVTEILSGEAGYDQYVSEAADTLSTEKRIMSVDSARFFDITIINENETVEPKVPVTVLVELADSFAAEENAAVIHYTEEEVKEIEKVDPVEAAASIEEAAEAAEAVFVGSEQFESDVLISNANISTVDTTSVNSDEVQIVEEAISDMEEVPFAGSEPVEEETEKFSFDENLNPIAFVTDSFSVYGFVTATLEKTILASDGYNYKITVTYGPDAGIPEEADLDVREILTGTDEYAYYLKDAAASLSVDDTNVSFARFFDIKIVKDGEEYEPQTAVQVKIAYDDALMLGGNSALNVVHFADNGTEVISDLGLSADLSEINYTQESFSVTGTIISEPPTGGEDYAIIIRYEGDWYAVQNNGSLAPVENRIQTDTEDKVVVHETTTFWQYASMQDTLGPDQSAEVYTIRHRANSYHYEWQWSPEENKYKGSSLPNGFIYKYIDINQDTGYEDVYDGAYTSDSPNHQYPQMQAYLAPYGEDVYREMTLGNAVSYDSSNHRLQGIGDDSHKFIGVVRDEDGTLRIAGNMNSRHAAEVYLAQAEDILSVSVFNQTVNHIDISVNGFMSIKLPLPAGTYTIVPVDGGAPKTLEVNSNSIPVMAWSSDKIDINEDDLKKADFEAFAYRDGTKVILDDVFNVTGYTGNAETGNDIPQVRLEGSFQVSDFHDFGKTIYDTGNESDANTQEIRDYRLAHPIYYKMSLSKDHLFKMKYTDPNGTVYNVYKGDQTTDQYAESVNATLANTFNYWDIRNKCPGIWIYGDNTYHDETTGQDITLGARDSWQAGWLKSNSWWSEATHLDGGPGMDFELGAVREDMLEPDTETVQLTIVKGVQDTDGNAIHPAQDLTNTFNVYQRSANDITQGTPAEKIHEATLTVGSDGYGLYNDCDVLAGTFDNNEYGSIGEQVNSIDDIIIDKDGKAWRYVGTRIYTENAWRETGDPDWKSPVKEYEKDTGHTGEDAEFASDEEVIGQYRNNNNGEEFNRILQFLVYNIYEEEKVDIPVIKNWDDFKDDNTVDWSAKFRLQWARVDESTGEAVGSWHNVDTDPAPDDGDYDITISKSDMNGVNPDDPDTWTKKFTDLPKYKIDPDGTIFRVHYSLDELEYSYTKEGSTYTWKAGEGFKVNGNDDPDAANHYEAFYPHDAGELSEESEDYYIVAANHIRNIDIQRYIDITLKKDWHDYSGDDDAWASFKLHRYKHTEYRDTSHMTDEDRLSDPITLTLVQSDGSEIMEIEVQPNAGVHLAATFAPHTDGIQKTLSFTVNGEPYEIISSPTNAGKEIARSGSFYFDQDTTIVITGGQGYLDGGYSGAQILDTRPGGTTPVEDTAYDGPVITLQKNTGSEPGVYGGWQAELNHLLQLESSAGAEDDNSNVTVYGYYFEEVDSYPSGYTARFVKDGTGIEDGTEANRIYVDGETIQAINEPMNPLTVKKKWRGVPDTTGYPEVTFTLYQGYLNYDNTAVSGNGGDSWIFKDENNIEYKNIPLNQENDWTWTCPVKLPDRVWDANAWNGSGNGLWRRLGYYVKEDVRSGQVGDDSNKKWKLYYYVDDKGIHANPDQPTNVGITDIAEGGTITITNRMESNLELDIKKQYFMLGNDGSWDNVTENMSKLPRNNIILGFKVIRRVKTMDGTAITGWMDYGDELKAGYDSEGNTVIDSNNIFFVYDGGSYWFFQIHNNYEPAGGFNEQVGLPEYGFYKDSNGQSIPVKYEYSVRESNVYKYEGIDNPIRSTHTGANGAPEIYGNLRVSDYPEWDWYSSLVPGRYKDADGKVHINEEEPFIKSFHGQDTERIANFQATDLTVTKFWEGDTTAREVYVKVYRKSPEGVEDFTHIIARDIKNNQNWQSYLEDINDIDVDNEWLILRNKNGGKWTVSSLKVNRALLGNLADTGWFTYYIEEVGYMDKFGGIHTGAEVSKFDPTYSKLVDGNWHEIAPGDSGYTLGEKGSNALAVKNDTNPKTSFEVTKTWADGYPTDDTKVSIKLQQRYRYERIFYADPEDLTTGQVYVWTAADGVAITDAAQYENPANWTLLTTVDEQPEEQQGWVNDWTDTSVMATLPVAKPGTFAGTDDEWKASADAWKYKWESLSAQKTINGVQATCYYRAVEVSEVPYNHPLVGGITEQDEYTGSKAVEDATETESITNNPTKLQLEIEKIWTKDGTVIETWPTGYSVSYQVYQDYHLVESGAGTPVTYTVSDAAFKSVPLNKTDSWNAEIVGDVSGTITSSTDIKTLTGIPGRIIYTATAADVTAAAENGVTLVEGTKYLVEFTYHVKETMITPGSGTPYTVDISAPAVRKTTTTSVHNDETDEDAEVTAPVNNADGEPIYKAEITNDVTEVVIKKFWKRDGVLIYDGDSATEWPEGYTVGYKVKRDIIFDGAKVGEETVVTSTAATALSSSNPTVTISTLPTGGIWIAAAPQKTDSWKQGYEEKELTAGDSYNVTYAYHVEEATQTSEGSVKPAGSEYTFNPIQAVFDDVTKAYIINNDLTGLKVEKVWDDYTPKTGDKVGVKLYVSTTAPGEVEKINVTVEMDWGTGTVAPDSFSVPAVITGIDSKGEAYGNSINITLNKDQQSVTTPVDKYDDYDQPVVYTVTLGNSIEGLTDAAIDGEGTVTNADGTVKISATGVEPPSTGSIKFVNNSDRNFTFEINDGSILENYNNQSLNSGETFTFEGLTVGQTYQIKLSGFNSANDPQSTYPSNVNYQAWGNTNGFWTTAIDGETLITIGDNGGSGQQDEDKVSVTLRFVRTDSTANYWGSNLQLGSDNFNVEGNNSVVKMLNKNTQYSINANSTWSDSTDKSCKFPNGESNYTFTVGEEDFTIDMIFGSGDRVLVQSLQSLYRPFSKGLRLLGDTITPTGKTYTGAVTTTTITLPDVEKQSRTATIVGKSGLPHGAVCLTDTEIELSAATDPTTDEAWSHLWTDLPKTDADGNTLYYYVVETSASVSGDRVKVSYERTAAEDNNGVELITITNKVEDDQKYGSLKVTKELTGVTTDNWWTKTFEFTLKNSEGKYLTATSPYVWQDGITGAEFTITPKTAVQFDHLPVGNYVITETSTAQELEITAYVYDNTNSVKGTSATGISVTEANTSASPATFKLENKYTPKKTSVSVTKAWKNADGSTTPPPEATVTFELYRSGTDSAVAQIVLDGETDANGEATAWTATWTDLPMYSDNEELYTYTVKESVTGGYSWSHYVVTYPEDGTTHEVKNSASDGEIITNTETTTDLTVDKQWFASESAATEKIPTQTTIYYVIMQKVGDADAVRYPNDSTVYSLSYTPGENDTLGDWESTTHSGLPKKVYVTDAETPANSGWRDATYYVVECKSDGTALGNVNYNVTYKKNSGNPSESPEGTATGYTDQTRMITIINTDATIDLKIAKKNESGANLTGAKFQLQRKTDGGVYGYFVNEAFDLIGREHKGPFSVDSEGKVTISGLVSGEYLLSEVEAPAGYVITETDSIYFTIAGGEVTYTDAEGNAVDDQETRLVKYKSADKEFEIKNEPGVALPYTGGPGTRLFTIFGSILVLGAGLLLWRRQRLV